MINLEGIDLSSISDETIAAFIDGNASPHEAELVAAHLCNSDLVEILDIASDYKTENEFEDSFSNVSESVDSLFGSSSSDGSDWFANLQKTDVDETNPFFLNSKIVEDQHYLEGVDSEHTDEYTDESEESELTSYEDNNDSVDSLDDDGLYDEDCCEDSDIDLFTT